MNTAPQQKRGSGAIDSNEPITRALFADLMEDYKSSLASEIIDNVNKQTFGVVSALANRCEEQFNRVDKEVSSLKSAQGKLEDDQAKLKKQLDELNHKMGLAESQFDVSQTLDQEKFVREPFRNKLKVETSQPVSKQCVFGEVEKWLTDASFNNTQWVLSGPNLGRRFGVHFKGDALVGARCTERANNALRTEEGEWKALSVPLPTSTADSPQLTRLYINPDQSPQAEARFRLGKKVCAVLNQEYPGKDFTYYKKSNRVNSGKIEIAEMVCESFDNPKPLWNPQALTELGIDKDLVGSKLKNSAVSSSSASWCF